MYNPAHGRFTAVDPLLASGMPGNPQTWNRYTYVLNNPLFWVDPTGLIWGKNDDNQVKWFDKKLGKGFSEFTPDAWQYEGTNGRIIQLDANSSNWSVINPVEVVAESNPIQDLVQSTGGNLSDSITGLQIGARNAVTGGVNALTNPLGPAGSMAGVPNPLEIAPLEPGNARQAAYAFIAETGVTAMASAGAGSALAGPASAGSSLSLVSETAANAVPRTPLERKTYPVTGKTDVQAWNDAAIQGPKNHDGTKAGYYDADYRINITSAPETSLKKNRNGTFTATVIVKSVAIQATEKYFIPNWQNRNDSDIPESERQEWNKEVEKLEQHEKGHSAISNSGLAQILKPALESITQPIGTGTGKNPREARNNAAQNAMKEAIQPVIDIATKKMREKQKAFDSANPNARSN